MHQLKSRLAFGVILMIAGLGRSSHYYCCRAFCLPQQPSSKKIPSSSILKLYNQYHSSSGFSTNTESIPNKTKIMEIAIQCSDGVQLSAKEFSSTLKNDHYKVIRAKSKILCLHGWLDNAASFNILGSELTSNLYADVIALDFPGHGHSSHKSSDGPTQVLSEYALYVAEALKAINWIQPITKDKNGRNTVTTTTGGVRRTHYLRESTYNKKNAEDESSNISKVTIIGHSMGAGVALIFAAAYPEYVDRLILLEGAGPLARDAIDTSRHVRQSIERRMASNKALYPEYINIEDNIQDPNFHESSETIGSDLSRGKRQYASLRSAVDARMKTATLSPGRQYISREAATALVCRATYPANESLSSKIAGGHELNPSTYDGPVYFRHDPRLMWPSIHYYSQEQVYALMGDVQCPTCLLLANDGWPVDEESFDQSLQILNPTMFRELPGSHHFHADPDDAGAVSGSIIEFLQQEIKIFH